MAYRRGFGRGRGWKHCHTLIETAKLTKEEEKKILKAELREIEEEKQEIEKKLKELEEKI
jgi:hypothetical protein